MNLEQELLQRSDSKCELCGGNQNLQAYEVAPKQQSGSDDYAYLCEICTTQIEDVEQVEINHWRCLNDSIWSEVAAVKVLSWRMLNSLKSVSWTQDLLDMMYLEEDTLSWAKAGRSEQDAIQHLDSNGVILAAGDTVTLVKDLDVKGANFTAKRGTAVRRISLVADNPELIEGKINGQRIMIITKFVKKAK